MKRYVIMYIDMSGEYKTHEVSALDSLDAVERFKKDLPKYRNRFIDVRLAE